MIKYTSFIIVFGFFKVNIEKIGKLRFILPCKSDCQPMFLKKARHLLILRKILTCKAPD